MRSAPLISIPVFLAIVSGCGQSGGPFVYVPEGPQEVTLTPSASATKVQRGETVTLHVERRTSGQWKKVSRSELKPGQCWLYQPPAALEPEVAHSVKWQVEPEGAVEFHTEYQLDQSRVATMTTAGKIQLTPIGTLKCEENRSIVGTAIEIEVS